MSGSLPRRDGSPSSPARSPSRPCAGVGNNAVSARCSFLDVACGLGRGRRIDAPSLFQRAREQQRGTPSSGHFTAGSNAAAAALHGRGGLRKSGGGSGVQWRLLLLLGAMLAFIAAHFVDPVSSFQLVTGGDDSDEDDEDSVEEGGDSNSNDSSFLGSNHRALPRLTIISAPSSSPFKQTIAARVLPAGNPIVSPVAVLKRYPRLPLASRRSRQERPSMMSFQPPTQHMLGNVIAALRKTHRLSVPRRVRMFASSRDNQPVDLSSSSWTSSAPLESRLAVSPFTTSASSVSAAKKKTLLSSSSEVPDSATSAAVVTHHMMIGGDPGKVTSSGHSTIQRFRKVNGKLKQTFQRTSVLGRDGQLHVMESHHPMAGAGPMSALSALNSAVRGGLGDDTSEGSSSDEDSSSSGWSSGVSGITAAHPASQSGGPETPEFWGDKFDQVAGKLREHLRRSPKMHRKLNGVLKRRMDLENRLARKILDEKLSVPEKVNEDEIEDTIKMLRVKLSRRPPVMNQLVRMLKDNHPSALEDLENFIRHLDIE